MNPTLTADNWRDTDAIIDASACPICHSEMCEDPRHFDAVGDEQASTPQSHLTIQRAVDLIGTPRPIAIVDGFAYADCLTAFVSESGTGKTFVLLDVAGHVSAGLHWHGRSIQQGSVFYLAYEGDALGLRLRALRDVAGHRLEHVYIARAANPLSPRTSRDGETRSLGELEVTTALTDLSADLLTTDRPPIVLVGIDTVRASLAGSEDSSEHVAAYIRAVRRIMTTVPGAAVVLAHHAGWQDGDSARKRERGSSAWRGNVDATIYLEGGPYNPERGEAELTLRALKIRDAERPAPLHLIRRRVELAENDGHGQPVTSCVIDRDYRTRADREAEQASAADLVHREIDRKVLRAMREYPAATSITRLRPYVGLRTGAVSDAVARLVRAGWAVEGQRGQPYTVTEAGLASLAGDQQ